MPKKIHPLTIVLFAAFGVAQLPAQLSDPIATDRRSDEPQQMVVNYGEEQEISVGINGGVMDPVGLVPEQVATMTITFPRSWAGMPVTLGRLDGGVVDVPTYGASASVEILPVEGLDAGIPLYRVPVDGAFQFTFQSDATSGVYRVMMSVGTTEYLLRFYAGPSRLDVGGVPAQTPAPPVTTTPPPN
jgi:hypothetical protein